MNKPSFLYKCARVYFRYRIKRPIPFALYLPITWKCNLDCKFCNMSNVNNDQMDKKHYFKIIDDAKNIGVPYISIYGGEPLMRADLEEIGQYIKKSNILSVLTTNGTLINPQRAKKLTDSFDIIKVSFSGFEKNHDECCNKPGAYKSTNKGLQELLRYKKDNKIIINFVANNKNFMDIEKFVDHFKNIVDGISILPENNLSNIFSDKRFIKLWNKLQKMYNLYDSQNHIKNIHKKNQKCGAGELFYKIYPNGTVNACNAYQPFLIGSTTNTRLLDIHRKGIPKELKNQIDNCQGCFLKCTTEVTQIFQMSLPKLFFNIPRLMRTYRLI